MEHVVFEPNSECLLTGAPAQRRDRPGGEDAFAITSRPCGTYVVSRTLAASSAIWERRADKLYLIAALARRYSDSGRTLRLMTTHVDDEATLDELLAGLHVPADPLELIDALLLFVHDRLTHAADWVPLRADRDFTVIVARNPDELGWVTDQASKQGLLEFEQGPEGWECRPTATGWYRVRELKNLRRVSDQAFVAMSFSSSLASAWEEGIRAALTDQGWQPVRVDGIEHNQRIDDLIIAEIRRSGLMVADFTEHRPNVYFEAGFARGLGIPVIWTCRQDDIANAHFDTRQFNHIVWEDARDLRDRLRLRVLATLPRTGG